MREPRRWREAAAKKLTVPLWTVDADVIVPSKLLEKEQYAARIIRPRLQQRLQQFLPLAGNPTRQESNGRSLAACRLCPTTDPSTLPKDGRTSTARCSQSIRFAAARNEALRLLDEFVKHKLAAYPENHGKPGDRRNQPSVAVSALRPNRPAHRHACGAQGEGAADRQRRLTSTSSLPGASSPSTSFTSTRCTTPSSARLHWAHKTLAAHARDPRPVLYTREQFEAAETHDDLWNAAQLQMLHAGWMHNYMRMYWAKKILEWSPSPAVAWQTALYLNDKYFLDGRDPDGYAGVAWAMGGKFDRPWFERPIFGTIRWMSGDAARKKFDADKYIRQMYDLAGKVQSEPSKETCMLPNESETTARSLSRLWPHRLHESNYLKNLFCNFGLHRWASLDLSCLASRRTSDFAAGARTSKIDGAIHG